MLNELISKIEGYFEFAKHKANWNTEILAGVSTFLALSYIFVVNPAILAQGGFDKSAVLFATIVVSAFCTLLMGLWAKKPLVLAPGMEINAYVAFFVISQLGFSWQDALGAVFWSGVLFLVITFSGIRQKIIEAIPDKMKSGFALCVGVFLGLIALRLAGVLTYEGIKLSGFSSQLTPLTLVFVFGLVTLLILQKLKVKGAVLISIALSTALAHFVGLAPATGDTVKISSDMLSAVLKMNIAVIFDPRMWNVILIIFLVDFYGNVAKLIGLTRNTSITNKDGSMNQMKEALVVDGIGAVGGAALGTTSVLTYVESAVGISEGGRTGITAITCAVLMLAFLVLTPLVSLVPVIATTGALLWVGLSLFPSKTELRSYSKVEVTTVAFMILTVIYTFAIDKALLVGFAVYILGKILEGKTKDINPYMIISTILLSIGILLSL